MTLVALKLLLSFYGILRFRTWFKFSWATTISFKSSQNIF